MNHKQRCVTGILAVVILGTLVAIQMWVPTRSEAAPAARQAGRIAHNPVGSSAVVKAEGEIKGK